MDDHYQPQLRLGGSSNETTEYQSHKVRNQIIHYLTKAEI